MEPITATATLASHVRPDILTDRFWAILRQHGVVRAALFGSFARGEGYPDSDIDLLVTFSANRALSREFLLADELRLLTGRPVDALTAIHPAFQPYNVPTLVPIPL
jgi:predicted nucleotidyltransferase